MSAEGAAVIRPRTTGELLDDAWRLYFADAPVLLLLSGVFLAPAFGALLLLAALPAPSDVVSRLLPPLLPLPLLVLTGLGSGACQEWLRARAEGRARSFAGCLTAAFRRGLSHTAARAAALSGLLFGLGISLACVSAGAMPAAFRCVFAGLCWLPALALWPLLATVHAFFASEKKRCLADLGDYLRLARHDTAKVGVVTLSRLVMAALVFVNLHLLVEAGLQVLDSAAGFDAAFVAMQLTITNPVYDLALALLSWLLLAPFFEASNFLLLVDARARREGLDLQMRVQNVFSTAERRRVGVLAVLMGLCLFGATPARAAETRYDAVHAAHETVERIIGEAKAADPYDGGRWEPELRQAASRLEEAGPGQSFAWFRRAVQGFAARKKDDGLRVLNDLDERLGLLEETLSKEKGGQPPARDDLKGLLQQPGGDRPVVDARPDDEEDRPKEDKKPEEDNKDQQDDDGGGRPHSALLGPPAVPGCGQFGLALLAGLGLAVVGVGAFLFIAHRNKGPRPARAPLVPAKSVQHPTERHEPLPHERPAAEWWREADELARQEQYLQAVRTLYHAVLSLLHRAQLLRFEPTRTNGEYVRQVRLAPQAPPALHAAFQDFTALFERKWYGDRACDAAEFREARTAAEEIQALVREA